MHSMFTHGKKHGHMGGTSTLIWIYLYLFFFFAIFMSDVQVWWNKLFLSVFSWLLRPHPVALPYWLPHPHIITFAVLTTLWAGAHTASHQRVLPNTRRTTFINVTGLLPTVHFFLWVPQVHFSCSSSTTGYLVWPVPLQQYTHSISFKVLQSLVSADMNYISDLFSVFCYQLYLAEILSLCSY